jgi:hypothetical protein
VVQYNSIEINHRFSILSKLIELNPSAIIIAEIMKSWVDNIQKPAYLTLLKK